MTNEQRQKRVSAKKEAEKLEGYEQSAYDGGVGSDWLERIGENLKYYFIYCSSESVAPSLAGFMRVVDKEAKEMGLHE